MHGWSRSIIAGKVKGVHEGCTKTLDIVGTGYRAVAKGKGIEFFLGYHTITVNPPEGIEFELPNLTRRRQGHRQAGCGSGCQNIRKLRLKPYKGSVRPRHRRAHSRKAGKAGADMSVAILGKGKEGCSRLSRTHLQAHRWYRRASAPAVTRSNRHMVAQIVDDTKGITLVSASTLDR